MPTEAHIDDHFTELGDFPIETEDGNDIKIKTYVCDACGSLVIVKKAHWNTHNSLPTSWV
jgi:hypothetical protein